MSAVVNDDIQPVLQRLENRNRALEEEVKMLRATTIAMHLQAEAGEEFIALQLMKKLRTLQAEKVQLVMEVDREEEHMTNNLQRQLTEARQAKVDLENQLEAEQESIVHRMHRQIQQNAREKAELVSRLESLDAELVLEMQSCSQAQRHVFVALASALGIEIQSRSPNSAISSSASTPAQSDISSILESAGLAGDSTRSPSSEDLVRVAISILDRVDARLLRSAQKHKSSASVSNALISDLESLRVENRALQLELEEARATIASQSATVPMSTTLSSSSSMTSLSNAASHSNVSQPTTPRPDGHLPTSSPTTRIPPSSGSESPLPLHRISSGSFAPLSARSPRVLTPRSHPSSLPPALEAIVHHVASPLPAVDRPNYPRDASQPRRGTMSGHHSPARAFSPSKPKIGK